MSVKQFFKSKWFAFGLIAVIATVAITASVLIFTNDGSMRIQKLGGPDMEHRRPSEYAQSRLWLHEDIGTFTVRIARGKNVEWTGVGTYRKSGSKYIFTYVDIYSRIEGVLQRNTVALALQQTNPNFYTYPTKNKRIVVHNANDQMFHFG